MRCPEYSLIAVSDFPSIAVGDNVPRIISETLRKNQLLLNGDILIVTHKIISIAENAVYRLDDIEVSPRAREIASKIDRPPKVVEVALREAAEVIRESPVLITRLKNGLITDMAGVDTSNAPDGYVVALPRDPDASAKAIGQHLSAEFGFHVPVIVTDTQGRPWRRGAVNQCIGLYGLDPFTRNSGRRDLYARTMRSSLVCIADELAAASELLMRQADEGIPAVIVRGFNVDNIDASIQNIFRVDSENLFR